MKIFLKKLYNYKYIMLLYIVLLIVLIPLFKLCQSTVPSADDFWYGAMARNAYKNNGSLIKVIGAAVERTNIAYQTWQGTYTSVFIMSMQPGIFSLELYRASSFVLILIMIICPIFLAYTLSKYVFATDSKLIYILSFCFTFITLEFIPSVYQGIYWFNSAWYYTFTFNLVLVLLGCIFIFQHSTSKAKKYSAYGFMIAISMFLGGTNMPQILFLTVISSMFIFLMILRKDKNRWLLIIWWVILGIFISLNVFAPGNFIIGSGHVNLRYTFLSMINSFTTDLSSWSATYITLAVCACISPFLLNLVRNAKIKFLHPAILIVVSTLILLCMYTPYSFIHLNGGPLRAVNIRMMMMQILLYANIINIFGYYRKAPMKVSPNMATSFILATCMLLFSFTDGKIMKANSIQAQYSIMGLEVDKFSSKMNEFFELLEDDNIKVINVDKLPTHEMLMPSLNSFKDYGISAFYDKDDVQYYK